MPRFLVKGVDRGCYDNAPQTYFEAVVEPYWADASIADAARYGRHIAGRRDVHIILFRMLDEEDAR